MGQFIRGTESPTERRAIIRASLEEVKRLHAEKLAVALADLVLEYNREDSALPLWTAIVAKARKIKETL